MPPEKIIYVHGKADLPEEGIIFGHNIHPQSPEEALKKMGPRFKGLFAVECVLYETDKHVFDNIFTMMEELVLSGVDAGEISDIYVLGHSLGEVDREYFFFLNEHTNPDHPPIERPDLNDYDPDDMDEVFSRIEYIVKRYGNDRTIAEPLTKREEDAIARKFWLEQAIRDARQYDYISRRVVRILRKDIRMRKRGGFDASIPEETEEMPTPRTESALWHISCFSDEDRARAERLMEVMNCKNYEIADSIDALIEKIKA